MNSHRDQAFTLVELMVVVLIVGILIAVAVPVFNSARSNAQKRTCQSSQRTVEGAYQTWYADDPGNAALADDFANGPLAGHALLTAGTKGKFQPDFVKSPPGCPGTGTYTLDFTASGLSVDVICTIGGNSTLHAN